MLLHVAIRMGNLAFFIRTDAFVFEDNWLVAGASGNSIASAHFVYRIYRSLQNRPERVKDIITSFHNQFSLPCTTLHQNRSEIILSDASKAWSRWSLGGERESELFQPTLTMLPANE
jgi:hypothetical protein